MKKIVFFSMFLLFSLKSYSQTMDVGVQLGGMMYSGDLDAGGVLDNFESLQFAYGLHGRYNINRRFSFRLNYTKGKILASDSSSSIVGRDTRNLSFESDIKEFSFLLETNILGFDINSDYYNFSPYFVTGVAVFKFSPKSLFEGQYYALQPIGTEGQGMTGFDQRYSLTQIAIPIGLGLKYQINEKISIGLEINVRFTFTDYLDDVSGTYVAYEELLAGNGEMAANLANRGNELTGETGGYAQLTGARRGNADVRDYYMSGMIMFNYHFQTGSILGRSSDVGCPTF